LGFSILAKLKDFHTFVKLCSDPTLILYPGHFGATGGNEEFVTEVAAATVTSFLMVILQTSIRG
jgi:hypothetical protein